MFRGVLIAILIISISLNYSISAERNNITSVNSDHVTIDKNKLAINQRHPIENPEHDYKSFVLNNCFTKNRGQIPAEDVILYIPGNGIWFTENKMVIELTNLNDEQSEPFNKPMLSKPHENFINERNQFNQKIVTFEFINCNNIKPIGVNELSFKSNFFNGNDSGKWYTDVPNYKAIIYQDIYDNIDLKYYFTEHGLKYDYIVHPGGDPNDIAIKVDGAEKLTPGSSTRDMSTLPQPDVSTLRHFDTLTISTGLADILDTDPFVYQEKNVTIVELNAGFRLIESDCYGFLITEDYDKDKTLIIDPLIFSTYLGGVDEDICYDIEIDESGNVFLTGSTQSNDFPVISGSHDTSTNGNLDIFVTKLNADGAKLLYSTFIGGDLNEESYSIKIDTDGSAYITGYTYSENFPTTPGANSTSLDRFDDVFVCKLSPEGNALNFSTYIGGWWYDRAFDLVLDNDNNVILTGFTHGIEPLCISITSGVYHSSTLGYDNTFITKLSANGSEIICSTLIGTFHDEYGWSIALDKEDNICIAGFADNVTLSTDNSTFPTTPGAYRESYPHSSGEGFVLKMNANMSTLLYSTFIGPVEHYWEWYGSMDLCITEDDNIIITGNTKENSYPTTQGAFDPTFNGNWDGLILKLNANLSSLEYATYLGGKNSDTIYDSMLDTDGNIIVVGITNSSDFPVLQGVYDPYYNANMDVFVSILNLSDSQLCYSTYLGGNGSDYGYSVAEDKKGRLLIAGKAEKDFPTTENSFAPSNNGFFDSFLCKLSLKFKPVVLDLGISDDTVYRAQKVNIYSTVSDKEDPGELLTPYFEYKLSDNSANWSTNSLSSTMFVNDAWQCTLTVPINASLGDYDLRVRYRDSDDMWSPWKYLSDAFLVKNNPPVISYLEISNSIVYIGDNLTIITIGSDVEDDLAKLTFITEYKYSDSKSWVPVNISKKEFTGTGFEFTFSITSEMSFGFYDVRLRVNDTDLAFSSWTYMNNSFLYSFFIPTILSLDIFPAVINRTESVDIHTTCTDGDTKNEDLNIVLQFKPESEKQWQNISSVYTKGVWTSNLTSESNWLTGKYYFRVRAIDIDDHQSPWFYINDSLTVLNNIPVVEGIEDIPAQMYRGDHVNISVEAMDVENGEMELKVELEYKVPGENEWLTTYITPQSYSVDSWKFDFTLPFDAQLGDYSFRAGVSDLDNGWSEFYYRNNSIEVVNSAPKITSFEQTPNEVFRTGDIIISANGNDLETNKMNLVCMIYYQVPESDAWENIDVEFDDTSGTWQVKISTSIESVPGNYSFKVLLRDSDGALSEEVYVNSSVYVKNNLPIISSKLDDLQVGKTEFRMNLTGYGIDIETPKESLRWLIDETTINSNYYQIDINSIEKQELIIFPKKSIKAKDDITIILIDTDNGNTVKSDVTIIVNSEPKDEIISNDENISITHLFFIYIILILIITLIILFIYYRKKKQKKKKVREKEDELAQEPEKTQTEYTGENLLPDAESSSPEAEAPKPVPVPVIDESTEPVPEPVIEEPKVPIPVPMPAPAEVPELPAGIDGKRERGIEEKASPEQQLP